jgi:A/G-specific adenine glycosylase
LKESEFSTALVKWWSKNGRKFPWRSEKNLYRILVAETLLHRTRAQNVVPVYLKFMAEFPDIKTLSECKTKDVIKITRSLGLTWRWNLLKQSSITIEKEFFGQIPLDREKLMSLPGVGDYIASAIRVFVGGFNDPLIDSNTVRIICRVYGYETKDSIKRRKEIRNSYSTLIAGTLPSEFGYALIDLGASICVSNKPLCRQCPVLKYCKSGKLSTEKIRESNINRC